VDSKNVATGSIPKTVPVQFSVDETLDVDEENGTPVVPDYTVPFRFTSRLEQVVI
jgi:arylsulfatase